jgi:hypothetical protein
MRPMAQICNSKGCRIEVAKDLESVGKCVMHFTLTIEEECAAMRRETALGDCSHDRQVEFMGQIASRGEILVRVATSGFPMSDELKARVLSTLLSLMNCRESIDRAANRQAARRRFGD